MLFFLLLFVFPTAPLTDKPPKILFPSENQMSVVEMALGKETRFTSCINCLVFVFVMGACNTIDHSRSRSFLLLSFGLILSNRTLVCLLLSEFWSCFYTLVMLTTSSQQVEDTVASMQVRLWFEVWREFA